MGFITKVKSLENVELKLEKDAYFRKKFEGSQQESNLRPFDYLFGCSTTELQETCERR